MTPDYCQLIVEAQEHSQRKHIPGEIRAFCRDAASAIESLSARVEELALECGRIRGERVEACIRAEDAERKCDELRARLEELEWECQEQVENMIERTRRLE